jgi:alpha-ketoglutarate-dependent taurine dioxygenase
MKHQRRLTVNPVAGALGAEVGGVTLAGELSDHEFSEIHRVFLDHQVLFFRGQHLPSFRSQGIRHLPDPRPLHRRTVRASVGAAHRARGRRLRNLLLRYL